MRTARAVVPATCGELLQGVDVNGPVLVSLPIDVCGSVEVTLVDDPDVLDVVPPLPRAVAALRLALDRVDWRGGAVARLGCEVPRGRGMGSSTVDVAGILGATFVAAGVVLSRRDLLALMCAVEPSDSSPLPGLWAIDHVGASRAVALGRVPASWHLVAVDSELPVDTLDLHAHYGAGPLIPGDAFALLLGASPAHLARAATDSARRNQSRLPHPVFVSMESVVAVTNSLGLCVAHSGSLCAAICDGPSAAADVSAALRSHGLASTSWHVAARGMRVEILATA